MACFLRSRARALRRRSGTVGRVAACLLIVLLQLAAPAAGQSVFMTRPDDPNAIHLSAPQFGVRGDGATDDSAAIQAAIDKAATSFTGGLLFMPSGRYRVTRTIYVWRGVRIAGYQRPGRCSSSATTRPASRRGWA